MTILRKSNTANQNWTSSFGDTPPSLGITPFATTIARRCLERHTPEASLFFAFVVIYFAWQRAFAHRHYLRRPTTLHEHNFPVAISCIEPDPNSAISPYYRSKTSSNHMFSSSINILYFYIHYTPIISH